MATRIRLARGGSKKKPFYRIVVADKRSPRDGKFIAKLGTYNPLLGKDDKNRFSYDKEQVTDWLSKGAIPSEKVAIFLFKDGFEQVKKYLPSAYPKSLEELKKIETAREEKIKAEAEAKAKEEAEKAEAEKAANAETETKEA